MQKNQQLPKQLFFQSKTTQLFHLWKSKVREALKRFIIQLFNAYLTFDFHKWNHWEIFDWKKVVFWKLLVLFEPPFIFYLLCFMFSSYCVDESFGSRLSTVSTAEARLQYQRGTSSLCPQPPPVRCHWTYQHGCPVIRNREVYSTEDRLCISLSPSGELLYRLSGLPLYQLEPIGWAFTSTSARTASALAWAHRVSSCIDIPHAAVLDQVTLDVYCAPYRLGHVGRSLRRESGRWWIYVM